MTYKTKARSASAVPTGAAPPLLLTVGEPPETPFSKSKKSRRGKSQKICKGFSGGARPSFAGTGGGAWVLRWLSVKMSSSECVKSLHSKSPSILLGDLLWSHDRGLNPRPHPYHGCALPTELSRHIYLLLAKGALHILLPAVGRALRPTVMYVSRRSYRGTNIILTDNSDVLKPCVGSIPSSRTWL